MWIQHVSAQPDKTELLGVVRKKWRDKGKDFIVSKFSYSFWKGMKLVKKNEGVKENVMAPLVVW